MLTSKLRVAGVVRAAAALSTSEHGQVDAVATAAAGGDAVEALADVLYLVAALPVELEAALLAGGGWWRWCWVR
jgi:hypothetical protein